MSYRGGRRSGNNRNGGGRGMAVDDASGTNPQQSSNTNFEIRNWESGTPGDVISFLERKTRLNLRPYKVNGPAVTVELPNNKSSEFLKWSGVRFAGQKLSITSLGSASAEASGTMQILNAILQQRYDPNTKLLNFAMMMVDPTLLAHGLLASPQTAMKMFQALLKVAADLKLEVQSVSLEQNQLVDVEIAVHVSNSFPKLLNLSLANNQINSISNLTILKSKFQNLRELVLAGNPLQQHPAYAASQVREIVNMFPRLMILDGQTVRTEADLPRNALPVPVKPTFFEDDAVQQLVGVFLSNFFGMWDTNRQGLQILYDESSLFSLCLSGNVPHVPTSSKTSDAYLRNSRNLMKNHSLQTKHNRIHIGTQSIMTTFNRIPQTKHDLTNPELFQMDAWKIQDIRAPGDTAIMMVVHGEFTEMPGSHKRSFDRTLVVLPGANGSYLIASDMLTVRGLGLLPQPTPQGAPAPGVVPGATSTPSPAPGAPMPGAAPPAAPMPGAVPGAPGAPMPGAIPGAPMPGAVPGAPMPGAVPGAVPGADALNALMSQTNLKMEFADMCLKQANYDLNAALQLFEQSRAQLGPDAFN